MKDLPPLKSLRVFLVAAKCNSFKDAAEQLFVTQAAVSQQIRLLEHHLACQLFERSSHKTVLTVKGKLLKPFIERAFEQIKQGLDVISNEPNPNELRITALHSVTSLILIPKVEHFQASAPHLSVQFIPDDKLESFEEQSMDVAIRWGQGDYPNLESRKIIDGSIIMIASPMLVKDKEHNIKEIAKLALLNDISDDIQEVVRHFKAEYQLDERHLQSTIQTTGAMPVIQYALSGHGVAFANKALVAEFVQQGALVNVLDYEYKTDFSLYLVAPPHHFNWDKVKRFEHWLNKTINTHQLGE